MKLRDGREFDPTVVLPGGRYNIYDCAATGPVTTVTHDGKGFNATTLPVVHSLLAIDLDEGVTSMFVTCPDHGVAAESRFYRVTPADVLAALPVRIVWRRPTNGERKRFRREGYDHYERGGLAKEELPVTS